jgi:hypothetical protein
VAGELPDPEPREEGGAGEGEEEAEEGAGAHGAEGWGREGGAGAMLLLER